MIQIKNFLQESITEEEFEKILDKTLYRTTRQFLSSPRTNHITHVNMFKTLYKQGELDFAKRLLDLATKFEYYHPTNIAMYHKVLKGEII